jgi:hypothetical protein
MDPEKNFITLPSGTIINLANVAYIEPAHSGKIEIVFTATYSVSEGPQPLMLRLDEADSKALLKALSQLGVRVSSTREKGE